MSSALLPTLLQTKFTVPPAQTKMVLRPRLLTRLDTAWEHPLTILTAPAGYGKTTLVSAWVHQREEDDGIKDGHPSSFRLHPSSFRLHPSPFRLHPSSFRLHPSRVGWLSLDENDNDPVRFLRYLIAALQTVEPALGRGALALLALPSPPAPENILTPLLNQIANCPSPITLILDDYHELAAPAIRAALTFLVERQPANLHLILTSRAAPPLPLARLRARGRLNELGPEDLRFTRPEMLTFLQAKGLSLPAGDMLTLETRTEGWVTGLYLAALALQRNPAALDQFTGEHPYLADYLFEEVFDQQSPETQEFLLASSLLDRLTPALCAALLPHYKSQIAQIFNRVEKEHLFLFPLDESQQWFRYHQLFRDFLRGRVPQAGLDAHSIHHRAAHWFWERGLLPETVAHALKAGDHELVGQIIVQSAEDMLARREWWALRQMCEALPSEMVAADPALGIWYAWARTLTGQAAQVEPLLQKVEAALARLGAAEGWPQARKDTLTGSLAAIRSTLALGGGHLAGAARYALLAKKLTPPRIRTIHSLMDQHLSEIYLRRGNTLSAQDILPNAIKASQLSGDHNVHIIALQRMAYLHVLQGRLHEAGSVYRQILHYADGHGVALLTSAARRYLANSILFEWNQLDEAKALAAKAVEFDRQFGNAAAEAESLMVSGRIQHAQGEFETGWAALGRALTVGEREGAPHLLRVIHTWRARQALITNDLAAAKRWVQTCGLDIEDDLSFEREKSHLIFANALIRLGRPRHALRLLARIEKNAHRAERWHRVIEIKILQAGGFWKIKDEAAAMQALRRALILAEPHGFVRLFIDAGEAMPEMLELVSGQGTRGYAKKLLVVLRKVDPHLSPLRLHPLPDSLSEREREILALLATGLSNQQIANQLTLGLNTIRWHNRNIYQKLGVKNRTQAAAQARKMGLNDHLTKP